VGGGLCLRPAIDRQQRSPLERGYTHAAPVISGASASAMVEGFGVASGAWSMLFREMEDARWGGSGGGQWSHNQSLRTTGLTPTTSARALVYMGKSSTGKERATHAHGGASPTSHSSAAVLKSYVSGPNRERSLRLCQGCLTSRLGRTGRQWIAANCWPCSHAAIQNWQNKDQQPPSATQRLMTLDSSTSRATWPRATPQSEAPEA
jgi:hypothetical protein